MFHHSKKQSTIGFEDKIIIVPDECLEPWAKNRDFRSIQITPKKDYKKEIIIAPHYDENFINTDLLKFRVFCEEENIKVTSFGSQNQFPFFSMFSDEIVLANKAEREPEWYDSAWSRNWYDINKIKRFASYMDIEEEKTKSFFRKLISDDATAERYRNKHVFILKSTFRLYKKLVKEEKLSPNLIVCESKIGSEYFRSVARNQRLIKITGIDQDFQRDMVKTIGTDHYMGIQILCSNLSNWRYLCCGGSSNLFSIIPAKTLVFAEQLFTSSTKEVLRLNSIKRYGSIGYHMPQITHLKYDTPFVADEFEASLDLIKEFADFLSGIEKPKIIAFRNYVI